MSAKNLPNRLGMCVLAFLVATLPGCFLFGPKPEPVPETPPTPLVAFMIEHGNGDSATIDDPDFGQQIRVTMLENFTSAFGEPCKRASLLAEQRETEMAVICQKENGRWEMAPRIWGQGIQQR